MKLVKYAIGAVVALSTSVGLAERYDYADYSQEKIQLLKELSGEYENSRGEGFSLIFEDVEPRSGQGDLFGPEEFRLVGVFEDINGNEYEVDLDSFSDNGNGSFSFSDSEDDCDNPGCTDYEMEITLTRNKSGQFYATAEVQAVVDAEDLSVIWEENADAENLDEILDNACKDYYGKNAALEHYVDDYKNSVYCRYSSKSFMKKVGATKEIEKKMKEIDCYDQAAQEVLESAAEFLEVDKSELQARHIGGESFDGDLDSGNVYKDHMGEYFDIFLSGEKPKKAKALTMYHVEIYQYSNNDTGEVLECENATVDSVSNDEWERVYDLYLPN